MEAPLLGDIYKSNPHQKNLDRYRCFCKFHFIEHFTSSRNFGKEDSGMPNGSNRVWRKGRVHHRPHSVVVENRPHSFFSSVPCGENRGLLSCAFREAVFAQTPIGPIHLSPVYERKIECRMIRIATNPSPFEQANVHLVKTMFYDQWAPSGESSVSKP